MTERFDHYAGRVRDLVFRGNGVKIDFSDLARAVLHRSRTGLSPVLLNGLLRLRWNPFTDDELHGILEFISPKLLDLKIRLEGNQVGTKLPVFVEYLLALSPPLITLLIDSRDLLKDTALVSNALLNILRSFATIRNLTTSPQVFVSLLVKLRTANAEARRFPSVTKICSWEYAVPRRILPRLTGKADDDEVDTDTGPAQSIPFVREAFPALRDVSGNGITLWRAILPSVGQNIRTIFLSAKRISTRGFDLKWFIDVVGASCPSLCDLRLYNLSFPDKESSMVGFIHPLMQCIHLEVLDFSCTEPGIDLSYSLSIGERHREDRGYLEEHPQSSSSRSTTYGEVERKS
jgi:hypothetical protein